jgi:hypothetical protein
MLTNAVTAHPLKPSLNGVYLYTCCRVFELPIEKNKTMLMIPEKSSPAVRSRHVLPAAGCLLLHSRCAFPAAPLSAAGGTHRSGVSINCLFNINSLKQ